MTDYTDLKARLGRWKLAWGELHSISPHVAKAPGMTTGGVIMDTQEAAAAIDALEDDIARLQTAHVQMQRAHDDLAAELADLQHDMGRAQAALSAMATDNERLRAALQKHDAALTAPISG